MLLVSLWCQNLVSLFKLAVNQIYSLFDDVQSDYKSLASDINVATGSYNVL